MPAILFGAADLCWNFILGPQDSYPKDFNEDTAFYNVWGDLIAAAGFSKYYEDMGFWVKTEDVSKFS